jgi:acyl-CoA reductase-like NAD-dependent aldehyde dehydrogenase
MLIPVINPATEDVIDHIPRGTAEDAERAVQAARSAFRTWRWVPALEKASMLHAIAGRIREKQERLATLMTQEGGKPFCENRDEVEWSAACFDYYAEIGRNARGSSLPPVFEHQVNFTIKEPYGVIVAIVPWNYPLLLMSWKVAPALAAGNTVIIKPSEETPLATLALAEAFTVLPKAVVSIVTGYGEEIGEALELANDSTYGLGANIYTNNMEWAMKAMERITAGTFWINDPLTDNDAGPFGGMRQTGHSRELGEEGLDEFRETKHVHLDYKQELKPYWYPYSKYNGM